VPLPRAGAAVRLLNGYFSEPDDDHEAYRRTGLYAWELYGARPTGFWMAASHSTGEDEWSDGVMRIDVYWFAGNRGDPTVTFYPPLWHPFRASGIPTTSSSRPTGATALASGTLQSRGLFLERARCQQDR
jgi:hypothetical protein